MGPGVKTTPPAMVGNTISHYRVLAKLGEGGMGVVYAAHDQSLDRQVALKFCRLEGDPQMRRALFEEARAASNLIHPNIAQVYEIGSTEDGEPFIAMELVPGCSLADKLRTGLPEIREAVRIVSSVARALNAAHEHKLVHRDIKPSNIRMTDEGEIKVLDFGLATACKSQAAPATGNTTTTTRTMDGVIRGTPGYMSPEQVRGGSVDGRTDLFSLGVVLYECLTGSSPFAASTRADCLANVLGADPPPPSAMHTHVEPSLDHITLKLLAKEPTQRYQSASELLAALDTLDSAPQHRALTPRRWATGGGAALGLLLFAMLLWRWAFPVRDPPPDARHWYAAGVASIADGTFLRASKALERATAIFPEFTMAHALLAEAWDELEYGDRAKQELLTAMTPGKSPRLSAADSIRLKAGHSVLIRDYGAAADRYRELAAGTAGGDRAIALVELGRIYERLDRLPEAKQAYQDASRADPQAAAPYLRLGTLYVRQRNPEGAVQLDRAMVLYRSSSNLEGITECLYQKARLTRDAAASLALLDQALAGAHLSENEQQVIQILLLYGDRLLRQGHSEQAIQQVNRALEQAQKSGLENLAARCLIDRGRMFFEQGDAERGKPDLLRALEIARGNGAKPTEARALANLGSLLIETGKIDEVNEGIKDVGLALQFYRSGAYRSEINLASGILGRGKSKAGDYEGAAAVFREVIERSRAGGVSSELAVAQENLAAVLQAQGRFPEASVSYEEACTTYRQLKQSGDLARTTAALATISAFLGRDGEAVRLLKEARQIAAAESTAILEALLRQAAAWTALSAGDSRRARVEAEKAALVTPADDQEMACANHLILGFSTTRAGNPAAGYEHCATAARMSEAAGNRSLTAEAALCSGEAALQLGREDPVTKALQPVESYLQGAGDHERLWRVFALLARTGSDAAREDARRRAREELTILRAAWPGRDYASYCARPDNRRSLTLRESRRKGEM